MKNLPNFKDQNGKTVYKEKYVAALTNAVYAGESSCTVDGEKINILNAERTSELWDVVVSFDYAEDESKATA
jgi:hypothetical protein